MENVSCPVKTAGLSYRHQIDKTFVVMVDNTGTKVKFQRLVTLIMFSKRVAVRIFLILVLHIFGYTGRKAYVTINSTLRTDFRWM